MAAVLQSVLGPPLDIVRPYLLPITSAIPAPIAEPLAALLTPKCYTALVSHLDINTHPECLPLAISKVLGVGIITMSSIVKLPQIRSLLKSQSADGVSFLSYLLETAAYSITLAYNLRQGFAFSSYGETALILVQNLIICVLLLKYSGQSSAAGAFIAGVVATGVALFGEGYVNESQLKLLTAATIPLGTLSKLPAIYTVWKQGGIGNLSVFAVFNYLVGSLARVFTTLQETNDNLILAGFLLGAVLNAVLVGQVVYYMSKSSAKRAGKQKAVEKKRA